tara:strand:+ start:12744 stop:15101 length:2358 start_codon:yes stop_codon:yes gene_type:complete
MDSKQYAAAMAVIELLKNEQAIGQTQVDRDWAAAQENFRYERNKADLEARQELVNERQNDNLLFTSLNQRVGQVDKDWTKAQINELKLDINKGKGKVSKDADHYEEFDIMYNSLTNLLDSKLEQNQTIWTANDKFNEFEIAILGIHNADSPQALSGDVKKMLDLSNDIIEKYRDDMEASQRSQFNKYMMRDIPKIKSMINVFEQMDSDKTDKAFSPNIKDFGPYSTQIDIGGQVQTINKSADQARLQMIAAYNYFRNGNFNEAQKQFNKAILGYRPHKASSISSNTTPTGIKDKMVQVVNIGGAYHIRSVWDPSANNNSGGFSPYGQIGTQPYNQNLHEDLSYKQLEERWTEYLVEWSKDKISTDPFNILTQKIVTGYFGPKPKYNNVQELRDYFATKEGSQILSQMTSSAGLGGDKGRAMASEVLYMLENPVLLASAESNVANFGNEFTTRMLKVESSIERENLQDLQTNTSVMYDLYKTNYRGTNIPYLGGSAGVWDWREIYEHVYGKSKLSKTDAYEIGKTEKLSVHTIDDKMLKARTYLSMGLDAYLGTESDNSITTVDYAIMNNKNKSQQDLKKIDSHMFQLFTRWESSASKYDNIISNIKNSKGDYDEEVAGNLIGFNNKIHEFSVLYMKKYYGTADGFNNMKDRISRRLVDGIDVGDGHTLIGGLNNARGQKKMAAKWKTSGNVEKWITQDIVDEYAPNSGLQVVAVGNKSGIQTPYGTFIVSALDFASTIESVKLMGLSPGMKSDNQTYWIYGGYDKKALNYTQLFGEPYPIRSTGK